MSKVELPLWDVPEPGRDFVIVVRSEIAEANDRVHEVTGGINMNDNEPDPGKIEVEQEWGVKKKEVFTCAFDGCSVPVKTQKGIGAYCLTVQPNGKTHRQIRLDQLHAQGCGPGGGKLRGSYKKKVVRSAKNKSKLDNGSIVNDILIDLQEAYTQLTEARRAKKQASEDLAKAEEALRDLLEDEIESLQ